MEGWTYNGPFDELPAEQQPGGFTQLKELTKTVKLSAQQAHRVILWDEVGETEGTGIVHIAPGCGAEDFQLGKQYGLPLVAPLDEEGHFVRRVWLAERHARFRGGRADLRRSEAKRACSTGSKTTPTAIQPAGAARPSWSSAWWMSGSSAWARCMISRASELTAEEKARSLRYQIMDVVDQIQWIPDFGHAREMDWLRNMHDWMISKKRYWGLALPIWTCEKLRITSR